MATDRLGSVRMDQKGNRYVYYSNGELVGGGTASGDLFATYNRESATGLDYAVSRYYDSVHGRFDTKDRYQANCLLLACVILCTACGWRRSLDFKSPNGAQSIEIFQPPVDPMLGLRVDYVTEQRRATVLKAGESYVGFAHVFWPENTSTIGILIESVKDTYGADPGRSLPSDCIGTYYQEQLRRRYPNLPH